MRTSRSVVAWSPPSIVLALDTRDSVNSSDRTLELKSFPSRTVLEPSNTWWVMVWAKTAKDCAALPHFRSFVTGFARTKYSQNEDMHKNRQLAHMLDHRRPNEK